jgi:2-C-methyl-D-erythritol 4-phosphate cytidylyltransferase
VEKGVDALVPGAPTRSGSVRAGLSAVPPECDVVVVHDAARPLAGVELFTAVVAAVEAGADGAIPGVRPASTIKRVNRDGRVAETLDRSALVEVQTPQAFRAAMLREVHATEPEATDDAALIEVRGGSVMVVDGDPINIKLTHPHDLEFARAIVAERA